MKNKISSRYFKIDRSVYESFCVLCDELSIKKQAWERYFIAYEIDFLFRNLGMARNTDSALNWLEKQHNAKDLMKVSMQITDELINDIDTVCSRFNITRALLVAFALKRACERIPPIKKLSVQREDLLPLYRLEQSFNNRLTQEERRKVVLNELVIGNRFRNK